MKKALTLDGKLIEAAASSPAEARCPYCLGKMVLRHRHRMDRKKVTYFWRHLDNRNLYCSGRARPVS
jgi:DNA-directed RNA polymerase subunit RPC12/RpoP